MRNVIRVVLLLTVCAAFAVRAAAQAEQMPDLSTEFGDVDELAGQRRVYVLTENLASRDKVLKELAKSPYLEVVGDQASADFCLVYGANLVFTGPSLFGGYAEQGNSIDTYGGLVAFKSVPGADGTHRRIYWYTHKRQTFVRTEQFFRPSQFNDARTNLITALVGGLLSRYPKLAWIPLSRSPETNAARDFVKALKKAYERNVAVRNTESFAPTLRARRVNPTDLSTELEVTPSGLPLRPTVAPAVPRALVPNITERVVTWPPSPTTPR